MKEISSWQVCLSLLLLVCQGLQRTTMMIILSSWGDYPVPSISRSSTSHRDSCFPVLPLKECWRLGEEVEIVEARDETVAMMQGALEAPTSFPAHLSMPKKIKEEMLLSSRNTPPFKHQVSISSQRGHPSKWHKVKGFRHLFTNWAGDPGIVNNPWMLDKVCPQSYSLTVNRRRRCTQSHTHTLRAEGRRRRRTGPDWHWRRPPRHWMGPVGRATVD